MNTAGQPLVACVEYSVSRKIVLSADTHRFLVLRDTHDFIRVDWASGWLVRRRIIARISCDRVQIMKTSNYLSVRAFQALFLNVRSSRCIQRVWPFIASSVETLGK